MDFLCKIFGHKKKYNRVGYVSPFFPITQITCKRSNCLYKRKVSIDSIAKLPQVKIIDALPLERQPLRENVSLTTTKILCAYCKSILVKQDKTIQKAFLISSEFICLECQAFLLESPKILIIEG